MASYGGGNRQQSFSFPMLSNNDILAIMHELQISLSEQELEQPNARVVRPVYEKLCELCMDSKDDGKDKPELSLLDNFEFPELHSDSVAQLSQFRSVCKLLDASGVHDTKLTDLVKPDPKRFRRNISAVINFAKFREERDIKFSDLANQSESLVQEKMNIEQEIEALRKQIDDIEANRQKEMPEIERYQAECREFEAQINDYNKEQAILKYEANQIKSRNNEIRDETASMQFQTLNIEQETQKIQGNIVQSPARLKGELELQQQTLELEKQENNRMEKSLRDERARIEAISRYEKDIHKTVKVMEDLEEQMMKCKKATKDARVKEKNIETHSRTMRELEVKRQELKRQLKFADEKMDRLSKQKVIKSEAAKHALNAAQEELDALKAERDDMERELASNNEEIKSLKEQIAHQKKEHEAVMLDRKQAYDTLKEQVQSYNETLCGALHGVDVKAA